jgi:hypothetical protein
MRNTNYIMPMANHDKMYGCGDVDVDPEENDLLLLDCPTRKIFE